MPNFHYTHSLTETDSSAVDAVHYNDKTKELVVTLHGDVYTYKGVPLSTYQAFVTAPSLGRAFATLKRKYGPSAFGGTVDSVGFVSADTSTPAPDMSSTSTPSWHRPRDGSGRFLSPNQERGSRGEQAIGTPKALTYADDAVVTGHSSGPHLRVTLGENSSENSAEDEKQGIIRKHKVLFSVDGLGDRTYNTDASSVEQAISHLLDATNALGIGVKVKEVSVYFE